ncbi:hypothetical protein [Sphingomonas sp. AX6]|uniref:hypothetical protein n=1 Tax=Sphingomonas sp. AX6 TaxID=2653171 RepID=UPI00135C2720|nr:hypothetical protein [Sphingomonas sp. AX6]
MKMKLIAASFVLAVGTLAAPAIGQSDTVSTLLETANDLFGAQGFKPTGWRERGSIADDAEARHSIQLTAGTQYAMLGVCDDDCEDLDLEILDPTGRSVAEDEAADDSPIVNFETESAGRYQVVARMADCDAAPCAYGIAAFAK